jgi:uncharacterized protein RhaS with RHS repeats
LLYYRARYYNPAWGRFVSADPAGSGINPYVYAGDNPINHGDPSGLNPAVGPDGEPVAEPEPDPTQPPPGSVTPPTGPPTTPAPDFQSALNTPPAGDPAPADAAPDPAPSDAAAQEAAVQAAMAYSDANAGMPVAAASDTGAGGRMNPWLIKYTQNSVSWNFGDGIHNIGDTIEGLLTDGNFDTPPVRIFYQDGDWWTLDNRRVLTYRSAGRDIPYVFASP